MSNNLLSKNSIVILDLKRSYKRKNTDWILFMWRNGWQMMKHKIGSSRPVKD